MNDLMPIIAVVFFVLIIYLCVRYENKLEEKRKQMPKPIKTKILDSGSDGTKSGGVGRAVVGDIIAGPVGAVVGATTSGHKNKGFTMFKVWYDDGHVEVEKIFHDDRSLKYKKYLELLEDE